MVKMLQWKESIDIPDGEHEGQIIKIVERTDPYDYIDICIKLIDNDIELKYGCPALLSINSKLGKLLLNFGAKFDKLIMVDIEDHLKGKKCKFLTIKKKNKMNKEFSEIVDDSIKQI